MEYTWIECAVLRTTKNTWHSLLKIPYAKRFKMPQLIGTVSGCFRAPMHLYLCICVTVTTLLTSAAVASTSATQQLFSLTYCTKKYMQRKILHDLHTCKMVNYRMVFCSFLLLWAFTWIASHQSHNRSAGIMYTIFDLFRIGIWHIKCVRFISGYAIGLCVYLCCDD